MNITLDRQPNTASSTLAGFRISPMLLDNSKYRGDGDFGYTDMGSNTAHKLHPFSLSSTYVSSPCFLLYCLGRMIGCRWAFANASAESGDFPSVLITLPMDMKKLLIVIEVHSPWQNRVTGDSIPKCRTRSKHILP